MALPGLTIRQRQPRVWDPQFLAFVRRQRCCVCGNFPPSHAAHVRMACLKIGKRQVGKGERPDDMWAVALCAGCHQSGPGAQHKGAEEKFWKRVGVDPFKVAADLYEEFKRGRLPLPDARNATLREPGVLQTVPRRRAAASGRIHSTGGRVGKKIPPRTFGRLAPAASGSKTMTKPIGVREQQLRDMRERQASAAADAAKKSIEAVAAALPKTSGKKPVRRKTKRMTKR